jgi:hypothetical protein
MNKTSLFIVLGLILTSVAVSQVTEAEEQLRETDNDLSDGWNAGGLFSLSFSQVSLTNWAAGGQNSVSGNSLVSLSADYRKGSLLWNNTLDLGYGLMKQGREEMIKTDDKIELLSKAGIRATDHWYYAGLLNFRTQMAPGYDYPDTENAISSFLAPAYLLGAIGMDYQPGDHFTLFLAPVTGKITIVNDQRLADLGAFGVDPGSKSRSEFGGYIRAAYKTDITENISFQTKADFFSNYLDNPQNIDVNWETLLMAKVGRFITLSVATHLFYDADILFDVNEDGTGGESKVQFKQLVGVGLSYIF